MTVKLGVVKWFSAAKGYGFITPEGEVDGDDLFVHFSSIEGEDEFKSLQEGQQVEFEISQSDKGQEAKSVRVTG